jgi:hypothetical protein
MEWGERDGGRQGTVGQPTSHGHQSPQRRWGGGVSVPTTETELKVNFSHKENLELKWNLWMLALHLPGLCIWAFDLCKGNWESGGLHLC